MWRTEPAAMVGSVIDLNERLGRVQAPAEDPSGFTAEDEAVRLRELLAKAATIMNAQADVLVLLQAEIAGLYTKLGKNTETLRQAVETIRSVTRRP